MLRAAGDAAIELKASLPDALASAVFPAGVLLPLLARHEPPPLHRCIALDAHADTAGSLRLRVSDGCAPDAGAVERLRASLADLYGERVRLRVAGAEIELELPHEHA
jgi:hypothetical protein